MNTPSFFVRFTSFEPRRSIFAYVWRMWLLAFPVAVAVATVLYLVVGRRAIRGEYGVGPFIETVVVSPIIETMILALLLEVIKLFPVSNRLAAILAAFVFSLMHSLAWIPWGVIVAWPFYVMSRAYLAWIPLSAWRALLVTALVHAAYNFLPGLWILTGER